MPNDNALINLLVLVGIMVVIGLLMWKTSGSNKASGIPGTEWCDHPRAMLCLGTGSGCDSAGVKRRS